MSSSNRIGARIDRTLVEAALGYLPEVGESFAIDGLVLRVMARTIGVEPAGDGDDAWFDELFVASVEDVADVEAAGRRLRATFVPEEAGGSAARADDADRQADAELDETLRREIEAILRAA